MKPDLLSRARLSCVSHQSLAWTLTILVLMIGIALLSSREARPATTTFATGLNQPRGIAFDDAGNLYVAEAGLIDVRADARSAPIVGHSSRVSRFSPDGQRSTVVDGLPYTHYAIAGDVGVSDVAVIADTLYILTGEGYDDHLSRSVLRVTPGELPEPVANILSFVEQNTVFDSAMGIATLATNPYALVPAPDSRGLYITDGASGRLLHVTLDGIISVVVELPNKPPLTGVTLGPDGRIYFALFSALPLARNNGAIWGTDSFGEIAVTAQALTLAIDVAFDASGRMYVLEFSDSPIPDQLYAANSGRLLRIAPDGTRIVLLNQLNYPTAMSFSRTGDLYIAVSGAFSAAGQGAILKVSCRELGSPDGVCYRQGQP